MEPLRWDFSPEMFREVEKLWIETGVGRPERGDDCAQVERTLAAGGRLVTQWEGDRLLGVAWVTHDSRRAYVHHMAVRPDCQNRGIGRRLLAAAVEAAGELGLQAKLEVHVDNAGARKIYEEAGFRPLEGYISMIRR